MQRIAFPVLLLFAASSLHPQSAKPKFPDAAFTQHGETNATLTANAPRPMAQAIEAISRWYGWTIDFEDPHYKSHFDIVEDTDPTWRASHPKERGAFRISGGLFQSTFPEPWQIPSGDVKDQILQKLVADYNASGNPGKFTVRKEAENRYAVIGIARKNEAGKDEPTTALLDTPITIPLQERDAHTAIKLIVDMLSAKTGEKIYLGSIGLSSDPLQNLTITQGGSNIPARKLLLQFLDNLGLAMVWQFLFDPDNDAYYLRLHPQDETHSNAPAPPLSGRATVSHSPR